MKRAVTLLLGGIFTINLIAQNWQSASSGLTNGGRCFVEDSPGVIVCGSHLGLFRTTNNGSSWVSVSASTVQEEIIALGKNSTSMFAGGDNIYRSDDGGVSWTSVVDSVGTVFSFAFIGDTIYAASIQDRVLMSTDNGNNWVAMNNGLPNNGAMSILAKDNVLYVGLELDGIYTSSDFGLSWYYTGWGLPAPATIRCLETDGQKFLGRRRGGAQGA